MLKFFRTIRKKLIEEDNVRKYLFYAIGEILLVVIGILIALQVNNWNEQRKEQRIAEGIQSSIIKDLKSDLNYIDALRIQVDAEINAYDSLQLKLTDPGVSERMIVNLIRDEFIPYSITFEGFNGNSYRTASSSGSVNFLTESKRTALFTLYTKQSGAIQKINTYEMFYLNAISDFNAYYPQQVPFTTFRSGPVYDLKWQNPDFQDLTSRFNSVGTSKRNYYRVLFIQLDEIEKLSLEVLSKLEGQI